MIILKKVATLLGLFAMMLGLSVSQASASYIVGSGKDAMLCYFSTLVMPKGVAITGGNVGRWPTSNFNSAQWKNVEKCSKQEKLKDSYVKFALSYPVAGPHQLRILVVLCSSAGGAYVFKRTMQKPQSFTYRFKHSDHVSSNNPLFRKYCRK